MLHAGRRQMLLDQPLIASSYSGSMLHASQRQLLEEQPPLSIAPLHPHEVVMHADLSTTLLLNVTPPAPLATAAGSIYSAAYILQLGFIMLLPYTMEIWIEYSTWL